MCVLCMTHITKHGLHFFKVVQLENLAVFIVLEYVQYMEANPVQNSLEQCAQNQLWRSLPEQSHSEIHRHLSVLGKEQK